MEGSIEKGEHHLTQLVAETNNQEPNDNPPEVIVVPLIASL